MGKKILIVYYSHSQNTERLAQKVQQAVSGTLCELRPADAYPADYDAVVAQAKEEIKADYRPPLQPLTVDASGFDVLLVGSPNWCSTVAPPVATFLSGYDLTGKTVVLFNTNGGGGFGHMEQDVTALCPNASRLPGFAARDDSATQEQVNAWLRKIGLKK